MWFIRDPFLGSFEGWDFINDFVKGVSFTFIIKITSFSSPSECFSTSFFTTTLFSTIFLAHFKFWRYHFVLNSMNCHVSFFGLSVMLPINPLLELAWVSIYRDNWLICISKFVIEASVFLFMVIWFWAISIWVLNMSSWVLLTCSKLDWAAFMKLDKVFSKGDGFLRGAWGILEIQIIFPTRIIGVGIGIILFKIHIMNLNTLNLYYTFTIFMPSPQKSQLNVWIWLTFTCAS